MYKSVFSFILDYFVMGLENVIIQLMMSANRRSYCQANLQDVPSSAVFDAEIR
jgi:hypothetical protein